MTSTSPVMVISPTMASTFEVPISSPTIRLRSFFFANVDPLKKRPRIRAALPRDGEAARVAQVDSLRAPAVCKEGGVGAHKPRNMRLWIVSEHQFEAIAKRQTPGAPRRQLQRDRMEIKWCQSRVQTSVRSKHLRLAALRAG